MKGSFSKDKHEILFSQCGGINYNEMPEIYKRGTLLLRMSTKDKKHPLKEEIKQEEKPTEGTEQSE